MYHSPKSLLPISPQFSLPTFSFTQPKPPPCQDMEALRNTLEACLITESCTVTCSAILIAYERCLTKIDRTTPSLPK